MRLLKTQVLLRFLNSYVVDSPEPANISYMWNFGSLLGICLIIQILTGAFLAMHYTPNVDFAFNSVEHIMRDVNNGWIIRYTHANVASFFFIFVYMHIGRGLYYSSYKSPRVLVWSIGVIILILMMAIAFLGYVNNSPKWFYISISYLILFIIVYYTSSDSLLLFSSSFKKSKVLRLIYPIGNTMKNTKYNKLNHNELCLINSLRYYNRGYSRLCIPQPAKGVAPSLQARGHKVAAILRGLPLGEKEISFLLLLFYSSSSSFSCLPRLKRVPFGRAGDSSSSFLYLKKSHRIKKKGRSNMLCTLSMVPLCPLAKSEGATPLVAQAHPAEKGCTERLNTIMKELGLNPIYIFENLETEKIKKQILNETNGLSGIYMILNKITTDYYIGSASTNRFYARFSNHVIYFRGSKIVKSAVKKYELKNFAFIILELYPNIVSKINNKELLDLEDKYLKLLLPNYNILTEAGSSFGYKHTEIDRIKLKDLYSEARRERIGSLNKGKILSPETIEKLRAKALNRPPMSDVTKQKCISHTRPVVLYNLNGTVYGKYSSILEAAKSINCGEKTIRRALKTEKRLVQKQWIVEDSSFLSK